MPRGRKSFLGDSVNVQGSDGIKVPREIADFYEGKGMSVKFFNEHYGLKKGLTVAPQVQRGDPRLTC